MYLLVLRCLILFGGVFYGPKCVNITISLLVFLLGVFMCMFAFCLGVGRADIIVVSTSWWFRIFMMSSFACLLVCVV